MRLVCFFINGKISEMKKSNLKGPNLKNTENINNNISKENMLQLISKDSPSHEAAVAWVVNVFIH